MKRKALMVLGACQGVLVMSAVVVAQKEQPLYYAVVVLGTLLLITLTYEVLRASEGEY